jgi:hypothetical protein
MDEISDQQIYDLLVEISRDVAERAMLPNWIAQLTSFSSI